jgi:hypothetical protein
MGLFNTDKGLSGNSGNVSNGKWTLTGCAIGHMRAKAIRKEWTAPRTGDLRHRETRRPKR